MSTIYNGYTIIGVRLDNLVIEKLIKTTRDCNAIKKRGCSHLVNESARFCPECGKPNFVVEVKKFTKYSLLKEVGITCDCVVFSTEEHEMFVAISKDYICQTGDINYGDGGEFMRIPSPEEIAHIKECLRGKLEPYGLWDELRFGIWTVGQCS